MTRLNVAELWLCHCSPSGRQPIHKQRTASSALTGEKTRRFWVTLFLHGIFILSPDLNRFRETNLGCSPVHQAELRKLNKAGEICKEKADKQSAWVQRLFAPATEKTALPARLLSFACLSGEWETEASWPRGMESSHAALTGVVVCLVLSVGSQCLRSPAAAAAAADCF